MTLLAKFLASVPKNNVTTLVFVKRIRGKIKLKMVVPEVEETRAANKFCVKLVYTPTERFNLLQVAGGAPEMKKYSAYCHTRLKQGQKSIKDVPRSGCRKKISDTLVKFYERR